MGDVGQRLFGQEALMRSDDDVRERGQAGEQVVLQGGKGQIDLESILDRDGQQGWHQLHQ